MKSVEEIVSSFLCAFSKENEDVDSFFASIQSKIGELNNSLYFLDSENDTNNFGDGEESQYEMEHQWRSFLCLNCDQIGDMDDSIGQREELLDALISCCDVGAGEDDESFYRLSSASLLCLSSMLQLRNISGDKTSSIVGSRLTTLAPLLLQAFQRQPKVPNDTSDLVYSAVSLVQNLLPPRCRREECHVPSVRDHILLPASSSEHSISVAAAAKLLSTCIVESANDADDKADLSGMSPMQKEEYNETISLKKETVALQKIQDFRQVLENIVKFLAQRDGNAEGTLPWSIHDSLNAIYLIAPAALESQLNQSEQGRVVFARICPQTTHVERISHTSHNDSQTSSSSCNINSDTPSQEKALSLYSDLSLPPLQFNSVKQLADQIDEIATSLTETDADLWSVRFDALKSLEQILAGGVVRRSEEQRQLFLEKLRRMAISEQILDLRSQVTRQACRVVTALAFELREMNDMDCSNIMAQLVEKWLPALLKLSISGVRLMATQGTNCLLYLSALGGSHGYPRIVQTLCEGCIEKKVHQNHRKGCVMALTMALRVWGVHTLEKHLSLIEKAVREASSNRDPAVREEGRKAFWAMCSRAKFRKAAEVIMSKWDKREKKMMDKVKDETDAEWEKGGRMEILVRTGVDVGPASASSSSKGGVSKGKSVSKGRVGRSALPPAAARRKQFRAAQALATPEGSKSSARKSLTSVSSSPGVTVTSKPMSRSAPPTASPSTTVRTAKKVPRLSNSANSISPQHTPVAPTTARSSPDSPRSSRTKQQQQQRPWHRNANATVSATKARSSSQGNPFHISGSDTASTTLSCEDESPTPASSTSDPTSSPVQTEAIKRDDSSSDLSEFLGEKYSPPSSQQDFLTTEKVAAPAGESSRETPLPTPPPTGQKKTIPNEQIDTPNRTVNPPTPPSPSDNPLLSPHQAEANADDLPATPKPFVSRGEEEGQHRIETTTHSTPGTDPVLRYMAHPTPLSAEKIPRKKSEILPAIMEKLEIDSAPQEHFLGIQGLVQFAKEHGDDECWFRQFDDVLDCLLRGVDNGTPLYFSNKTDGKEMLLLSPERQLLAQPFEALSLSDSVTASRHLYLQGIRALLKYVPMHFESHVDRVVRKLLECSKYGSYELTHTAERALENLVKTVDPVKCLNALLPFLNVSVQQNGEVSDYSILLSSLRTLCKLVERLPPQVLLGALPTVMPCLYMSINHKVVDMRKASVFVIVQMHYILDDDLSPYLNKLSVAQHKLLSIYVERHKKAPQQTIVASADGSKGVTT